MSDGLHDPIEQILKDRHRELAGFCKRRHGMLTSPPGYLKRVRDLCTEYDRCLPSQPFRPHPQDVHLPAWAGITPDLMAISKGLTGGYMPLAATLTTNEIYQAFLQQYADFKTFFHGQLHRQSARLRRRVGQHGHLSERKDARSTAAQDQDDGAAASATQATPPCGRGQAAWLWNWWRTNETKKPYPLEERVGHRSWRCATEDSSCGQSAMYSSSCRRSAPSLVMISGAWLEILRASIETVAQTLAQGREIGGGSGEVLFCSQNRGGDGG